jgi:hypothetical protein
MNAVTDAPPVLPPPSGPQELDRGYIYLAYGAVFAAIVIAVVLTILIDGPALVIATGFTSFAVIYIVAQAIERFLQPISELVGKPEQVENAKANLDEKKSLVETTSGADEDAAKVEAEEAKKKVDYRQLERATYFWAAASVISLLVCGVLGLGLIQSVAEFAANKQPPGWFEAIDVVITGLAIGAGTKPLHDLISAVQKAKEKA